MRKSVLAVAVAVGFAGCAQGGNASRAGGDAPVASSDAPGEHDAATSHDADLHDDAAVPHDAAIAHDAAEPKDAAVPHDAPPDADEDGQICTGNDQCGTGYCCEIAFCVEGTAIGALCFPSGS